MLFVKSWQPLSQRLVHPSGYIDRLNTSRIMERMRQPCFIPT
nr:MAG TPA: hypothetical protein [Caudoviricetes sp.]